MRLEDLPAAYDFFNRRITALGGRLPSAEIIWRNNEGDIYGCNAQCSDIGDGRWLIELNKDLLSDGRTPMENLCTMAHEIGHVACPDDSHGPKWHAFLRSFGLRVEQRPSVLGGISYKAIPVPGGEFEHVAQEFLKLNSPSHGGSVRRFGPSDVGDCHHMIAADCSWSMNAIFDGELRRIDVLKKAVGSVWPNISNRGIIYGYAGGIDQVSDPRELELGLGAPDGTWFSPALRVALERDVDHLHLFSDGMLEIEDREKAFDYRNRGKFDISTYLIIEKKPKFYDASLIEYSERTMRALSRGGGGYSRIRTMADMTSAIQKNIGITSGAEKMTTTPLSRIKDYSGEVQDALEVVAKRMELNKQVVEVAGRVNDIARRVGAVERSHLIGSAMTEMLHQADAHAGQALGVIAEQYRADESDGLLAGDKLRTVLEGAGGEVARLSQQCFGGLLVNQATAAANAPDRSAPVTLQTLPLDAGVLAQVQALYDAHIPAQALPASTQPVAIEDRRQAVPTNAPPSAAPRPALGGSTGRDVTSWRPALVRRS